MQHFRPRFVALAAASVLALAAAPARADITIGAILSITGPTAAQGVGYKDAFALMPTMIDGQKVTYIIRDDGGDPTNAVTIARKMIDEDHVDALIGPASNAPILAVMPVANAAHVPMVGMAPVVFDAAKYPFTFDDTQTARLMVEGDVANMKAHGVKTVGFIGYSDGWGDQVLDGLKAATAGTGIRIVDEERYARTDTSVQPQVLRAMSRHPDAMLLGGSATPGALPDIALKGRNYKGLIYNNHGVVSPAYIRVGGAAVAGCIAPTGPLVVFDQLPAANPVKATATKFMDAYIAKFGPKSRNAFAGYSYDALLLIKAAVPAALKAGAPSTQAFRDALRTGMEHTTDLIGTEGVYNMTPTNHNGMDARSRVMVVIKDNAWMLLH